MKQLILGFLFCLATYQINAQCNAFAGETNGPENTSICNATITTADLAPTWISEPNGASNFGFLVTYDSDPNISVWDETIVGYSLDGGIPAQAFNSFGAGTYCFTGVAFNQNELNYVTNDPAIQTLAPCIFNNANLADILPCLDSQFALATIRLMEDSVLSAVVNGIVPQFFPPNDPFCYDVVAEGNEYCIEVEADCNATNTNDIFNARSLNLSLNPNPVVSNAIVSFNLNITANIELKIFNAIGSEIQRIDHTASAGENFIEINTANLEKGIYFYSLQANNTHSTLEKFVVH